MGSSSSVSAGPAEVNVPTPVTVNVYNVGTSDEVQAINKVLRVMGTGAFHCGVEVHGAEWSYRGTRFGLPGVFSRRPCDCEGHIYFESVFMGLTLMSRRAVHDVIQILTREWPGSKYDLLNFNCCHFCNRLCDILGVGPLPAWITSLASSGAAIIKTGDYIGARTKSFGDKVDSALCGNLMDTGGGSPRAATFSCVSCLCAPVSGERTTVMVEHMPTRVQMVKGF